MKMLCTVAVAASLSGCAQYEAQRKAEAYQAQMSADDAKCRSYGVQSGTPAYVQCRMNLDQIHAQDQQQRNALMGQYLLMRR